MKFMLQYNNISPCLPNFVPLFLDKNVYDSGPLSVKSKCAGIDPREWAHGDRRGHNILLSCEN